MMRCLDDNLVSLFDNMPISADVAAVSLGNRFVLAIVVEVLIVCDEEQRLLVGLLGGLDHIGRILVHAKTTEHVRRQIREQR